jgi:hypothetical protein
MRYKMRIMIRSLIILLSLLVVLASSGCGIWRGDKDVGSSDPTNDGPGLITGRNGGIVIYQR